MNFTVESLRSTTPEEIELIMLEEELMWRERLKWDYRSTHEFIRNYVRLRMLPGLVLKQGERPLGYAYMVENGGQAMFGNIYVLREGWGRGGEGRLAEGLIETCKHSAEIKRIEAQLMIFSGADLRKPFIDAGFSVYRRNFRSLNLEDWNAPRPAPEGFQLARWRDRMIAEAAQVVYESYRGGVDAEFAGSFARPDKCNEFVYNIARRSGCGEFAEPMSTVALDERGALAGVVLATTLSPGNGHLPQISVLPAHHGRGVGAWLVAESLSRFKRAGYRSVSLTVTERNEKADAWYDRIGFARVLGFYAYLWTR